MRQSRRSVSRPGTVSSVMVRWDKVRQSGFGKLRYGKFRRGGSGLVMAVMFGHGKSRCGDVR